MEKLLVKNGMAVKGFDMETGDVTITVNINGLIDAKEGKDTHVIISDNISLPRSDGKTVKLQLNGWYK